MKTCRITNTVSCWKLEVDNNTFTFNDSNFAEYLGNHYLELGYQIYLDQSQHGKSIIHIKPTLHSFNGTVNTYQNTENNTKIDLNIYF